MKKVIKFFQGKKTSIATILGALLIYLVNNGIIGPDEGQLISIILVALGLTANVSQGVVNARRKT
jgi:hypothetical protein